MVTVAKPAGFRPVRHTHGVVSFPTRRFEKDTSGATDANKLVVGDPVRLDQSGKVFKYLATDASAKQGQYVGIVARILDNNEKPKTFSQPTRSAQVSLTADSDFVDVYTDPQIVYRVNVDVTSLNTATIGAVATVTASTSSISAGDLTGRSPTFLSTGSVITSGATPPFRIVGLTQRVDATVSGGGVQEVEVIANDHMYNSTTGV